MSKFDPKKIEISLHAEERAVERLGVPKHQAKHHIRQLLQNAKEVMQTKRGITFEHKKSKTLIIMNRSKSVVLTVYKAELDPLQVEPIKPILTDTGLVKALYDEYESLTTELKQTKYQAKMAEHELWVKLYKVRIKLLEGNPKKEEKWRGKEERYVSEIEEFKRMHTEASEKLTALEKQYISVVGGTPHVENRQLH